MFCRRPCLNIRPPLCQSLQKTVTRLCTTCSLYYPMTLCLMIGILELVSESEDLVFFCSRKVQLLDDLTISSPRAVEELIEIVNKVHVSIRERQIIYVSVQLDSIRHRSPTVMQAKYINQPTNTFPVRAAAPRQKHRRLNLRLDFKNSL